MSHRFIAVLAMTVATTASGCLTNGLWRRMASPRPMRPTHFVDPVGHSRDASRIYVRLRDVEGSADGLWAFPAREAVGGSESSPAHLVASQNGSEMVSMFELTRMLRTFADRSSRGREPGYCPPLAYSLRQEASSIELHVYDLPEVRSRGDTEQTAAPISSRMFVVVDTDSRPSPTWHVLAIGTAAVLTPITVAADVALLPFYGVALILVGSSLKMPMESLQSPRQRRAQFRESLKGLR